MCLQSNNNSCTLKEKLEVLNQLDKAGSGTKLAADFGVGKVTISDCKKKIALRLSSFVL